MFPDVCHPSIPLKQTFKDNLWHYSTHFVCFSVQSVFFTTDHKKIIFMEKLSSYTLMVTTLNVLTAESECKPEEILKDTEIDNTYVLVFFGW
jgi:hypothetical protein